MRQIVFNSQSYISNVQPTADAIHTNRKEHSMKITVQKLEGRDHFVVPTVMITEGVHAGSNGPLFYSAEVLAASAPLWNGKPIVVYHPSMQFSNGSAGDPAVFNQQKIGTIFNARMDGKRLLADAWIDAERVQVVDARVLNTIRAAQLMEVSTGLFHTPTQGNGVFNGKPYSAVVTNVVPDHLAILPDQLGACSIADGAGLCRNDSGFSYVRNGEQHDPYGMPQTVFNPGIPVLQSQYQEEAYVMPAMNAEGKIIGYDGKEVIARHEIPPQFHPRPASNHVQGIPGATVSNQVEPYAMPTIDWSK